LALFLIEMKILFIHHDRKMKTGAHYVNDIIVKGLRRAGFTVDNVYPEEDLGYFPPLLSGIKNILFFFSLIERKKDIDSYDIIQGTTYSPLAFLHSKVPVISMFGSTTYGFLKHTSTLKGLAKEKPELAKIFGELKDAGIFNCLVPPKQPFKDTSRIEFHVAKNSSKVIVTSAIVRDELVKNGVPPEKIAFVWNGIENFWFHARQRKRVKKNANIVYLGRIGETAFNVKLKGVNRMIYVMRNLPSFDKLVIGLTKKVEEYTKIFSEIPRLQFLPNLKRRKIPRILEKHFGDIIINTSRYEGFSLSLVEAMSQGLIPITFPVGVAPEVIKNGENGFLVNNMRQMVHRISKLQQDVKTRANMAKAAFETARMFRADDMVKKYIEVYNSVKGANLPPAPAVSP